MCDYSLMAIPSRLAVAGEELVTHIFETGSVGLASARDVRRLQHPEIQSDGFWPKLRSLFTTPIVHPLPAVCIPPGANLLVRDVSVELQQECGCNDVEEAVFTETSAIVNTFRDAVRFRNGVEVLLQKFKAGQRVRVLALSSAERLEPIFDRQHLSL